MMGNSFSMDDRKSNQLVHYKDSLEWNDLKKMDYPDEVHRLEIGAKFEDDSMDCCHIYKYAN